MADGSLTVITYGAIDASIDWRGDSLDCDGMRRPHDEGVRLRFAGVVGTADNNQRTLAFILSIPALGAGRTGDELPTRLTLIEEDEGRFFSTQEANICWSDIEQQRPLRDETGAVIPEHYFVSGLTYCVAAIAELNGKASVTLSDLKFSGQVNWGK